jgi:predicted metal-dependent hydrolase
MRKTPQEKHFIHFNNTVIPFTVVRKDVKRVNLRVRSDSTVTVSAGSRVTLSFIEAMVLRHAPWIIGKQHELAAAHEQVKGRKYISGEIIPYLGQNYSIYLFETQGKGEVVFDGQFFQLYASKDSDAASRAGLLEAWYKNEAKVVFNQSLDKMAGLVAGYGIAKPTMTIRKMKSRWGSCSCEKHKITINSELIKTPLSCIDYVILHELAHFKCRNHDASFYDFLGKLMPDWKEQKALLKNLPLSFI